MILTNQFTLKWDMKNVDRDYDVFSVYKPKGMENSNILDLQSGGISALAVQYTFGGKCLVLFEKDVMTTGKLGRIISDEYPDVTVKKINVLNQEDCDKNFYYQYRLLALLLMNSMHVPSGEGYAYNNLSGRLFYSVKGWDGRDKETGKPYFRKFLELTFDPGMYLSANVKTFRNRIYKKLEAEDKDGKKKYVAKYVFDKDTKVFRRKLKTDTGYTDDEIFCLAGFEGKRMSVKYINFTSLGSFKRSKAGVICRFLDDVREYLGEYFTLEQCIRDNDEVFCEKDKPKADLEDKAYGRILNEKGVNIVDECGIPLSQAAVKRIHSDLLDCFGVEATIGPIRESAYNIRIIYDREYYEDKKLKDEYISYTPGTVTQHITLPNAEAITAGEKRPDPIVRKLVMELVLKGDIEFGKVRVYDWKSISAGKEWSFVYGKKIKGKKVFRYYMVKISTGGKLSFSFFSDDDLLLPDLEEKIRTVYLKYEERLRKHDKKYVEGLLFSDPDHIHIISRTCMNTMPDIVKIRDAFVQTNPKEVLDKDKVKKALKQYGTLFPEDAEYVGEVYEAVETHSELLTKYNLKTIINVKKKAGKRLIRFLHEEHGIWIYHELKDSAFKDLYRLDNMTDIRYFIDEKTAGEDIRSFNYYAGIRSNDLNQSLRNACVVREVRTDDGDIEFKELLPLMAVDFVRIALYTVLPFPFKYLREYAKMCDGMKE